MKADAATEAKIIDVLKMYGEAYERQDKDAIMSLFVPDPDLVIYGAGENEKCFGIDDIRNRMQRDFDKSTNTSLEMDWYSVSRAGSVAWIAADFTVSVTTEDKELNFPLRQTVVLEERDGKWLIAQSHISVPNIE